MVDLQEYILQNFGASSGPRITPVEPLEPISPTYLPDSAGTILIKRHVGGISMSYLMRGLPLVSYEYRSSAVETTMTNDCQHWINVPLATWTLTGRSGIVFPLDAFYNTDNISVSTALVVEL